MKKPFYKSLYLQVLVAITCGVVLGHLRPQLGVSLKPLGDGFIKLVKMLIAPIIFGTVVAGIAGMDSMKKVGRVGGKALVYFEVVSTLALCIGLLTANLIQPGAGFNASAASLSTKAIDEFTTKAKAQSATEFLLNIIPSTIVDAFAKGEILQVVFVSVLFGFAVQALSEQRRGALLSLVEHGNKAIFGVVHIIMRVAPIGAFGAMSFTIGKYGIGALLPMAKLMGVFYLTCVLFVVLVLGPIARWAGFNIFRFLLYIREELLVVLGTSSSESALPQLMEKLERAGCSSPVVGLVVPTGYSFNLDGTNIYMTVAALFIAQATNTPITLQQQLTLLLVGMLTSKGASGVTGAGFITLAATLAVIPTIPVAGMALILGVDRFMSEARSITNLIGNGVATMVVARWENELDDTKLASILSGNT